MFWRASKPQKPQESLIAFLDQKEAPKPDPERTLAEALSEYERQFYDKIRDAFDQDADEAKKIVSAAQKFVSESRLGYALTRPLLEHIKYWPSWSKNDNFSKYAKAPFQYLDGSIGAGEKPKTTVISFAFNSQPFTVRFVDEGMFAWASDDSNTYGKVELVKAGETVLGLDIAQDLSKGDAAYWHMTGVYAFLPGPWMKELIEMAAYIDGTRSREHDLLQNKDALERARKIRVP